VLFTVTLTNTPTIRARRSQGTMLAVPSEERYSPRASTATTEAARRATLRKRNAVK